MIQIMGILNCTPDSFFDGGKYASDVGTRSKVPLLVDRALQMEKEGADWIDVGGESSRPGATPVAKDEELNRVVSVIQEIRKRSNIRLSIDTTKSLVASAALKAGVHLINDVSALTADPHMIEVAREFQVPVILMHSRGTPQTMSSLTQYKNVVNDVFCELQQKSDQAVKSGLKKEQIFIDPGFGFAKTAEQNIDILKNLRIFKEMGYPLVVGLSRKNFIGKMTGQEKPADRLYGSLACAFYASLQGADILRVHDVGATKEIIRVFESLLSCV